MPSWQARLFSLAIRGVVRRRHWGSERALARRARRVFGIPRPYSWFAARGLRRERMRAGSVRGEWLIPDHPVGGVIFYVHGGGFVSCSAATHRPITAAPMLLHVGSTELLLEDAGRVHERIRAAEGASRLEIYDDVPHCWQMLVQFVPAATVSLRDAAMFIMQSVVAGSLK